jgi:hypothetical protein
MYIYLRHIRPKIGHQMALREALLPATRRAVEVTGCPVRLVALIGGPVGTHIVSMVAPTIAQITEAAVKLPGDPEHRQLLAASFEHTESQEEMMVQMIGGAMRPEGPGPFVAGVEGIADSSHLAEAGALCAKLAERAGELGAATAMATLTTVGPYGQVSIASSYESAAHYESVNKAFNADAAGRKLLTELSPLMVPLSGRRSLGRVLS